MAGNVKVKPLEFRETTHGHQEASSVFGSYLLFRPKNPSQGWWECHVPSVGYNEMRRTLQEAIDYAQQNYTSRVLDLLEKE